MCVCPHLSGSDLDVKVAAFIRNLEDLGPGEAVDPQTVFIDQQAVGTHSQHDVHAIRVLTHTHESHSEVKVLTVVMQQGLVDKTKGLCSKPHPGAHWLEH